MRYENPYISLEIFWLSSRNFFGGESIVMLISLLFSYQISGGQKSLRRGNLPQGAPCPFPPPHGRKPVLRVSLLAAKPSLLLTVGLIAIDPCR